MRLVIVTGMSGAGKTSALKMLEDLGFYCVDNLPIPLMEAFVELVMQKPAAHEEVALGIDIRSGEELPQLEQVLENWKAQQVPYEILFLDSSDATLVKRYKETRRSHPLAGKGRVDSGIQLEREKLAFIKQQANVILDTSSLLTRELRKELEKIFVQDRRYQNLFITVLSFGFKYGIPNDADLVFDVRFLPNPYYVEALRSHTGQEAEVQAYVRQGGTADRIPLHALRDAGFSHSKLCAGGEKPARHCHWLYRREAPLCHRGECAVPAFKRTGGVRTED